MLCEQSHLYFKFCQEAPRQGTQNLLHLCHFQLWVLHYCPAQAIINRTQNSKPTQHLSSAILDFLSKLQKIVISNLSEQFFGLLINKPSLRFNGITQAMSEIYQVLMNLFNKIKCL